MDLEELLKEAGAFERALKDLPELSAQGQAGMSKDCWSAPWVLVQKFNNPSGLEQWWERHGRSCDACVAARARAERHACQATPPEPEGEVIMFGAPMDPTWPAALPYAASTDGACEATPPEPEGDIIVLGAPMDPAWPAALPYTASTDEQVLSRNRELPWIQYHPLPGVVARELDRIWFVTWDNMLFVLLVGPDQALAEWRKGALLRDGQGKELGSLCPVTGRTANIIAPGGVLEGQPAACFYCDASVTALKYIVFSVPQLIERGIQLVPVEGEPVGPQRLVRELVLSNYPSEFLGQLPEHVDAGPDVLTLNAYIRLLLHRSCVTSKSCQHILPLDWIAEDLRSALQRLME